MSAERAFLEAVRTAALADAGVQAQLGARLYDAAPADPVFPFATLGEVRSTAQDAAGAAALEHVVSLHVWSRHGGRAEALDAIAALRSALHDRPIAIAGRRLVLLLAVFADVFRARDGRTVHGVLRLRALTESNS